MKSPCTKRHTAMVCTSWASVSSTVGTETANNAKAITRLRPNVSAIAPVTGAVSATASVLAVMIALISAAEAPNSRDSSGSSACGEERWRNVQKPWIATARRRGERDRERARRHDRADLGRGGAELARQLGQQRLRRIEVEERAEAVDRDGETAVVDPHSPTACRAMARVASSSPDASIPLQSIDRK